MTGGAPDHPALPAFFLVGTGRSGTTLARTILCGHPDIAIPGETGFLPRLLRLRRLWWGSAGLRVDPFLRLAFANGRLGRGGFDRAALAADLRDHPVRSPAEAVGRIYAQHGALTGARLVGDKTPGYVDHLDLLGRVFPEASVIQMVRHPLDVVASLREQPWGPDDVSAAAMVWRLGQQRAERAGLDPRRRLVVRLEDLTADPAATTQAMAAHLGVTRTAGMLDHTSRADRIMAENIHPGSHAGLQRALTSTSRWAEELTPAEAATAWALVADVATPFGYTGPDGPAGRPQLLSARARLSLFETSRGWRRLKTLRRLVRP